jgi:hypothetical protein
VRRPRSTARRPAVSGDPGAIEQALALGIQVTQSIDLKLVGQDAEQQMAGQVRGRSPAEHGLPTGPKLTDIEITQGAISTSSVLRFGGAGPMLTRGMAPQRDRRLDWLGPALLLRPPAIW